MNTTSRIEQATRELERQFLVSRDALDRLADLEGFAFEDLGPQRLRGRAASIQVFAVEPEPHSPNATRLANQMQSQGVHAQPPDVTKRVSGALRGGPRNSVGPDAGATRTQPGLSWR